MTDIIDSLIKLLSSTWEPRLFAGTTLAYICIVLAVLGKWNNQRSAKAVKEGRRDRIISSGIFAIAIAPTAIICGILACVIYLANGGSPGTFRGVFLAGFIIWGAMETGRFISRPICS